ncbi:MAG: phosphopantetheine-binding protein [Verrucomicrobiota bacterium]
MIHRVQQSEIYKVVTTEISSALKVDEANIDPESFLIGDLGAESLDLVDLTFRMEKAFDIEIPEGQLFEGSDPLPENLKIKDVVTYLSQRLS